MTSDVLYSQQPFTQAVLVPPPELLEEGSHDSSFSVFIAGTI
jgi:hypothetical protein